MVILDSTPLVLARIYDSRKSYESGLGPGWQLNLQQTIEFHNGYVVFNEESGHGLRFTHQEGELFKPVVVAPRTKGISLLLQADSAIINYPDGSTKTFRKHPFLDLLYLTEIDFGMGNPVRLDYEQGRLTKVSRRNNTLITLIWDQNRLKMLKDLHGRNVVYAYDQQDRLTEVMDVAGQTWSYQYDEHNQLQQATYPNSETYLQVSYDDLRRVDSLRSTKDLDFDYFEGFTKVRTANGPSHTYRANEEGICRIRNRRRNSMDS